MRERLAILISGNGTTMEAIVKAWKRGEIPLDIACIISSNPTALGIEKAKRLGIPEKDIVIVNPEKYRNEKGKVDQDRFGSQILNELQKRKVTVVTQNNWMPLTPKVVIEAFRNKIFNQHPAPTPEFGGKGMFGKRVHAAVLLFNRLIKRPEQWTEAIAQRVATEFDQGAVVKSVKIPILPDDTVDMLQQRVLLIEHELQIELLNDIVKGKVADFVNRDSIVRPGEEEILEQVKTISKLLYPRG